MLPLAAYADRLSVRPGETIRFHAHNATDAPVEGRLVRVLCADANPAGPGVQLEDIESKPAKDEPGPQQVPHGSYGGLAARAPCLPIHLRLPAEYGQHMPTNRSSH